MRNSTCTIKCGINNTIDTSERRMNYYYYYLAISLQDLFKNGDFDHYIVSLAQQSGNHVADLLTVYNSSLAFKNAIDDGLDQFNITFSNTPVKT